MVSYPSPEDPNKSFKRTVLTIVVENRLEFAEKFNTMMPSYAEHVQWAKTQYDEVRKLNKTLLRTCTDSNGFCRELCV